MPASVGASRRRLVLGRRHALPPRGAACLTTSPLMPRTKTDPPSTPACKQACPEGELRRLEDRDRDAPPNEAAPFDNRKLPAAPGGDEGQLAPLRGLRR